MVPLAGSSLPGMGGRRPGWPPAALFSYSVTYEDACHQNDEPPNSCPSEHTIGYEYYSRPADGIEAIVCSFADGYDGGQEISADKENYPECSHNFLFFPQVMHARRRPDASRRHGVRVLADRVQGQAKLPLLFPLIKAAQALDERVQVPGEERHH